MADQVAALRASVATDPAALLQALQKNVPLRVPLDRLWIHALVLQDQNTDNTSARTSYDAVEKLVTEKTAFLQSAVAALPEAALADFLKREPGLAAYGATFADWRRTQPHRLLEKEEVLLGELETETGVWSDMYYSQTINGAPFGSITVDEKKYSVNTDFEPLMHLPDRSVRMEAYARRGAAFRSRGDAFASNLLRVATSTQRAAERRKFHGGMEGSFFDLYLAPDPVESVLEAFMKHADVARRFQRANARYVSRALGLQEVAPWDLEAPLPGITTPRLTISQASAAIREATAVFGPAYRAHLDSLLDPHNGKIDLVGGPRRGHQAHTLSPYKGDSIFFMESYSGHLADVVALAHEATHAVHFELIREAGVSWYEASPPSFIAEGAAKLNELLILDQLAKQAASPGERLYYLRELGAKLATVKYTTMYWAVLATKFELAVNNGVRDGTVKEPKDVHAIWMRLAGQLSESYAQLPDNAFLWANTPNFFDSPRTYVKYLYAWVLGAAVYGKLQSEPTMAPRFVEFLRKGSPDEPIGFVKRELGIDLGSPHVLDSTWALIEQRVSDFEKAIDETSGK